MTHLLHIDSSIRGDQSVSRKLTARAARSWLAAHPAGNVTYIIASGLSIDPETNAGLLGGREFLVIASRGGGYSPGTPREGWDHAETWLPHGVAATGLQPRLITAELTLADVNPAMAELKPLAAESLAAAERAIDDLWSSHLTASASR
jgi:FMN-dependent NADH-azoreductase